MQWHSVVGALWAFDFSCKIANEKKGQQKWAELPHFKIGHIRRYKLLPFSYKVHLMCVLMMFAVSAQHCVQVHAWPRKQGEQLTFSLSI